MQLKDNILGQDGRTALIKKNIVASFIVKGWSILVQLMLVPLTLHCLGVYENGIWLTISSMLLWIDNLDIGLGNGLRNKLAEHLAHSDTEKARDAVSSTFFMLMLIVIPIVIILNILIWTADTYAFLNVDKTIVGNLDTVLTTTVILVCSTFIFKFIGNFYMGLQLIAVSNLLVSLGHTLVLIATTVMYYQGIHSLLLISIANTLGPLLIYLIAYPVTFCGKYSYLRPSVASVKRDAVRELLDTSVKFFILQIEGLLLLMSSNLIISFTLTPEMVTPFQIAYRYFCIIVFFFTIICAPYWTATTDAYQRGDYDWIRRTNRTLNRMMPIMVAVLVVMIVVSRPVFHIWIGKDFSIPMSMTVLVAIYVLILVWSMRYSIVLNGIGALRVQIVVTLCATAIYIPLALMVGRYTRNINMLLCVMCLVNLPGLVINYIQYHKITNGTARGVWIT